MCLSSNVIDLSAVTAGAGGVESGSSVACPSHVSHDCTNTAPIYEHCGPPSSSSAPAAAKRPVPRPRSSYGKYHLENLKNINAESKPANASDDTDDDSFCH